ncbi:ABC-three component system protein [Yersinia proxima]|uniref:ABC-three component system protein n=1 Tax=Yersinia proxima TaxID=2890316 RepID=UPI003D690F55
MDTFENEEIRKAINSNASSSISGFLYQFQRALFHIFSSNAANTLVGVETIDDVSTIIGSDYPVLNLEQDKYTNKQNYNPFSDKNENLWHTINIWLSNLNTYRSSFADVNFFLTTNIALPLNSLALEISNADTDIKIDEVISKIKLISENKNGKGKDIKEVSRYDDDSLRFLIKRITVLDATQIPEEFSDIRSLTIQKFQLHSSISEDSNEVYEQLLGTIINQSFNKWQKKEQAWFEVQTFRDQLHNLQIKIPLKKYIDRDILSVNFKKYIETNQDMEFINQLTLLNLPTDYIDNQLTSFLGFYAERVRLQNEGYILPNYWEDREKKLNTRWKDISQDIEIEEIDNPSNELKGKYRKVLRKTLDQEFKEKLGENETNHSYFTKGHYHDLVNNISNSHSIYWYRLNHNDKKGK